MEDIIQLKDQFYVLATSSLADQRTRVLKYGEVFAVFDVFGNIQPIGRGTHGLFEGATRYLSLLELRVDNSRPLFLSSTVKNDNTLLTVDLMTRDATLHVFRSKFLWENRCFERVRVTNFSDAPAEISIAFRFLADFTDIFEIRGTRRERRGKMLEPQEEPSAVTLGYEGLDGVVRRTRLDFSPKPFSVSASEVTFREVVPGRDKSTFFLTVSCSESKPAAEAPSYAAAASRLSRETRADRAGDCEIWTSNTLFNEWIARSQADLHMMITKTPWGTYPYAGVPLFNTVFGRDGLITALQSLWINPWIARGVLNYLATTQATERNDVQDAEPGKILHEVRTGEMVALGEVPFRRYYGAADSTPLFIILAAAYFEHTGDTLFLREIWPNLERALRWIDEEGDRDGDGFIEYARRSPNGLINQGWKDSHDSVFHDDGTLAEGPIALAEIQAYVYDAKLRMAKLMPIFGDPERAGELCKQAAELKERFEKKFWSDDLQTYVIALDGKKRPCNVASSNAGHALFSGIASEDRARRVATNLLNESLFSGWGIRTVAEGAARYNPMSYHDGSIWPHDNSMIAAGFARYGMKSAVRQVAGSLFDAAVFMDLHRLPELFCGFVRRPGEGPTLYPVACSPQSWASASVFLLLQSLFGLEVRGNPPRLLFRHPALPENVDRLQVRNLRVGECLVDFSMERHHRDVGVTIQRRTGPVEVVIEK